MSSADSGSGGASKEELWYLDNYVLLKDYYDRTISRIAARCVRTGNIAVEDYKYYGYILDVLEEISDVGDYLIEHKNLVPYIDRKIAGGISMLKKELKEYKEELRRNATPDMIREDEKEEVEKAKKLLGGEENMFDPTKGAGMNMNELIEKLVSENKTDQD